MTLLLFSLGAVFSPYPFPAAVPVPVSIAERYLSVASLISASTAKRGMIYAFDAGSSTRAQRVAMA